MSLEERRNSLGLDGAQGTGKLGGTPILATNKLSGTAAWINAAKGQASRWSDHVDRFSEHIVDVFINPKFKISQNDSVFCIGSCFARNIEEHLIYIGLDVLSRRIVSPSHEWPHRINGFINKFTTHSMRNELEWVVSPKDITETMFEERQGGWVDLQLAPMTVPVSLPRAIERRAYLTGEYFNRLRQASIIIITLGLNEVWFDNEMSIYLNAPPSFFSARRDPGRYELCITDVDDNVSQLNAIRELIHTLNPDAKMVVTVSPVPMSETFSGQDVILANMISKSTLRAAADAFVRVHADVDYFPSYDIITMSPRQYAYTRDCLHVSDAIVGQMMRTFTNLYLDYEASPVVFNELAYLAANPDVEAAVRQARFSSGFEHWTLVGSAEGRPRYPQDGPTSLMITHGAA